MYCGDCFNGEEKSKQGTFRNISRKGFCQDISICAQFAQIRMLILSNITIRKNIVMAGITRKRDCVALSGYLQIRCDLVYFHTQEGKSHHGRGSFYWLLMADS